METRMSKYHDDDVLTNSRVNRNKDIYNQVKDEEIDDLSLTSNISVINTDTTNLNIDELRAILDEKYSKKKSKSFLDEEVEETDTKDLENTKEYDLNKILDAARNEQSSDYDRDRFRKLRNTEYEILNNLNLKREEDPVPEETISVEEANLMNLIKTVDDKELKQAASMEDDLLGDLKGSENTEILEPIPIEENTGDSLRKPTIVEELEKTKQLSKADIVAKLEETEKLEETKGEVIEEKPIKPEDTNTFYTGKLSIKKSDLDDFGDIQKELKSGIFVKILIIILVLIVVGVGVFLLNKYLNLGLF